MNDIISVFETLPHWIGFHIENDIIKIKSSNPNKFIKVLDKRFGLEATPLSNLYIYGNKITGKVKVEIR